MKSQWCDTVVQLGQFQFPWVTFYCLSSPILSQNGLSHKLTDKYWLPFSRTWMAYEFKGSCLTFKDGHFIEFLGTPLIFVPQFSSFGNDTVLFQRVWLQMPCTHIMLPFAQKSWHDRVIKEIPSLHHLNFTQWWIQWQNCGACPGCLWLTRLPVMKTEEPAFRISLGLSGMTPNLVLLITSCISK